MFVDNCIIDAPTWPVGFEKYVPDKPSFKRLLHWGPIIALIIILLVVIIFLDKILGKN